MARLVIESGEEAGMMYPVSHDAVTIGRGPNCTIQLMDRRVSRHHLTVRRNHGVYLVEDLDSRNGTLLNDQSLIGISELRPGDRIVLGGIGIQFELDEKENLEKQNQLSRVQMAANVKPTAVTSEKSLDSDTAPYDLNAVYTRELIKDPLQRLRVIYQVSDSLQGELQLENLLNKIMESIWAVFVPHRAIILIRDSENKSNQRLHPVAVKTKQGTADDVVISQGVVDKCMSERKAILMAEGSSDSRFSTNDSIFAGSIRSAICSPLIANGKALGVIYIDTQYGPVNESHCFTEDDLDLMSGIANHAALALQNLQLHSEALNIQRTQRELEIARDIQVKLVPKSYPEIAGIDFAAVSTPANEVGGDYYDFFQMDDGKVAIIIGDASGKGVAAAIFILILRTALRTQFRCNAYHTAGDIATALNRAVCSDALPDSYASIFMILYDPETRQFTYTNCGHVQPLFTHPDGTLERLDEGGPLLGVLPDSEYASGSGKLNSGDAVILYTDGVTDTHNIACNLFSEERLIFLCRKDCTQSAAEICDSVYESVVRFRESRAPFDDLTLLVMKAV